MRSESEFPKFRLTAIGAATSAVACLLVGCSIGKARQENPAYLRTHNAGSATFAATGSSKATFDAFSEAARTCYTTSAGWVPTGIVGGIFLVARAPGRSVEAKFDETTRVGTIRVFVDGNVYLPIFQVDVSELEARSRVDVFYAGNGKLHRNAVANVKAWADGDLQVCALNATEDRKRDKDQTSDSR